MAGRWWCGRRAAVVALIGLLAAPVVATEAILVACTGGDATFRLPNPSDWPPATVLTIADPPVEVVVIGTKGREVTARLVDPSLVQKLQLGRHYDLRPGGTGTAPATVAPAPVAAGTVTAVDDGQLSIEVEGPAPSGTTAELVRDGRVIGQLEWLEQKEDGRYSARLAGDVTPRLGDRVRFTPVATASAPSAPAPKPRPARDDRDPYAVIPGDDPLYDRLASLARRGFFAGLPRRQFDGEIETLYSRGQVADILARGFEDLSDWARSYEFATMTGREASQLLWLVDDFAADLARRGVPVDDLREWLRQKGASESALSLNLWAAGRVQRGDDSLVGKVEATLTGRIDRRLRGGVSLTNEGGKAIPDGRDRSDLAAYYFEFDPTHQITLGLGRRSTRFGPGLADMLWSDRAKPLDSAYLTYRTKLFGRPFAFTDQVGIFRGGGVWKYITLHSYEYQPLNRLTVGADFGLITDRSGQAVTGLFMPLYFARFMAGKQHSGGYGNFLGSVHADYGLTRSLSVYGELFADDFDFSPSPPRTAQRIGWLGGIQYIPPWALPGSSYRFEAAILPDPGTYVGQQNAGLSWLRDGFNLGHRYGEDSAGYRFLLRHRFTPRFDVGVGFETFRQLRSLPSPAKHQLVDVVARYDLNSWLTLGVGFRENKRENIGAVAGRDDMDNSWYFETRAGY